MATHSDIGIVNENGIVTMIYCNSDGDPKNVGKILLRHYQEEEKIQQLLAIGDLSVLGPEIGVKIPFETHPIDRRNQCLAYGRDRGDSNVEARTFPSLRDAIEEGVGKFSYFWKEDRWIFSTKKDAPQTLTPEACRIGLSEEDIELAKETMGRG